LNVTLKLWSIKYEFESVFIVFIGITNAMILAEAVNSLKPASKLLDRLVQIQDFRNRCVPDFGLNVASDIVLRLIFAGVFPRAVDSDHIGMEA